jgi:hypothetical protein
VELELDLGEDFHRLRVVIVLVARELGYIVELKKKVLELAAN